MTTGVLERPSLDEVIPHFEARRHLIIGQAPHKGAPDDLSITHWREWDSPSGEILAGKMGMSLDEMLKLFDTTNLNLRYSGKVGKWDRFDENEAKERGRQLENALVQSSEGDAFLGWNDGGQIYDVVLCAGKRVAQVMGAPILGYWQTAYARRLCGIPYPGGRNMWWNDPENRMKGDQFLKELGEYVRNS